MVGLLVCMAAGMSFFYKQGRASTVLRGKLGALVKMPELDGRVWAQMPEPR
jgi:protein gp37